MLKVKPELKKVVEERIEKMSSEPNPTLGQGIVVEARVVENMQCEGKARNFTIRADEPEEGGGDGTAPLPLQNMMAGAAFCALVWTVKSAALLDAKLDEVQATAQGVADGYAMYAREDVDSDFKKFGLKFAIKSPETDEKIMAVVTKALKRCPVWNTFRRAAPTEISVVHNGRDVKTWMH